MRDHCSKRLSSHDVALQEAVRCQAIGSMESGTRGFSDDEETAKIGGAVGVGYDSATLVVRGGDDWDRGLFGIMSELKKSPVDEGKPFSDEPLWFMSDVKVDAACPGFLDFRVNRSSHDIPRGERASLIVAEGKVFTLLVQ